MIEIFKGPDLPRFLFIWLARDADWSKASRTWWLSSPSSHSPRFITSQLLACSCIATDRCHILDSWVVHSAYWSGGSLLFDLKCPWCQIKVLKFRVQAINFTYTHKYLHTYITRDETNVFCLFSTDFVKQTTECLQQSQWFSAVKRQLVSLGFPFLPSVHNGFDSIPTWPLILSKVIIR